MGHACLVCNHPDRMLIDRDLVEGKSCAATARKYGVHWKSVQYHHSHHLTTSLVKAFEKRQALEGLDLLSRIDAILQRAEIIFDRNFKKQKDSLALKALDSQRNTIELLAKIAALLHEARVMDLKMRESAKEEENKSNVKEWITEVFDKLDDIEQELFTQIVMKINGEIDEIVLPERYEAEKINVKYPESIVVEPEEPEEEKPPVEVKEPEKRQQYHEVKPTQIPGGRRAGLARYFIGKKVRECKR